MYLFIHVIFSLGDRIAIISQGTLLCCGSFEYLKTRFGRGHELTLVTNTQSDRRYSTSSRTFVIQADVEETDQGSLVENHSPVPPIAMEDAIDRITNFIKVRVARVDSDSWTVLLPPLLPPPYPHVCYTCIKICVPA